MREEQFPHPLPRHPESIVATVAAENPPQWGEGKEEELRDPMLRLGTTSPGDQRPNQGLEAPLGTQKPNQGFADPIEGWETPLGTWRPNQGLVDPIRWRAPRAAAVMWPRELSLAPSLPKEVPTPGDNSQEMPNGHPPSDAQGNLSQEQHTGLLSGSTSLYCFVFPPAPDGDAPVQSCPHLTR